MFESEQQAVELIIKEFFRQNGLPESGEISWMPIPFSGEWGISTSFFQLAADEAREKASQTGVRVLVPKRAQEIATGIAERLGRTPEFSRIEAVNGYLNLYFSATEFSARVVDTILDQGASYGHGVLKNERVMVEFSQPNTHKAFHVGHLRSAILGDTLSRILEGAGFEVIRANYPGDIGLHVIKWLWNYLSFHSNEHPTGDITRWMGNLYAEATRRLEENPEYEAAVRDLYVRWDHRDRDLVEAWQKTRQWSLDGFNEIYNLLNIHFDIYYFNSQVEHSGKQVVDELIQKGIAEDERPQGPVIVKIDELLGYQKEKYRTLVILRSDNTALYSTEDLALAIQKFTDYPDLCRSLYVVDVRQSLHFQQVFKTLEIAGYPFAIKCQHIPYELVNLPGNVVMASREGTVVLLDEFIQEATSRAKQIVQEKNPELSDNQKQKVARAVALGALRYSMLARDNTKTVTFDWEKALDFDGQAAPYVQYAHVRANSILRKMDEALPESSKPNHELHPSEVQLIDWISRLPGEVQRAAAEYKPLHLTNLGYEIARAFSDFYNQCPVLKAEPDTRRFRLRLVAATKQALSNVLNLLGIIAPDVM